MEHLLPLTVLARISKTHILKLNAFVEALQHERALLLLHIIGRVHELEDLFTSPQRLLKTVVEQGHLPDRIVQCEHCDQKSNKRPGSHLMMNDPASAPKQQQSNSHRPERIHQWRADRLHAYRLQIRAEQPRGCPPKAVHLPQFHTERLHDAVSRDRLVQYVLNFSELILSLACRLPHAPANAPRRENHHNHKQKQHPGHVSAHHDHHTRGEDQSEDLLHEIAEHVRHRILHALDIVDESGQQRTGRVLLKKTYRPPQHRVIKIVPEVRDHAKPGEVHQVSSRVIAN